MGILFIIGCRRDVVNPPDNQQEDFSYPPSQEFAVKLYSNQTEYRIGDNIDVKLIFYNLNDVFGTAVEILYDKNVIEIIDSTKVLIGPYFKTGDSTLILRKVEQNFGRISIAISYIKGSEMFSTGSGVVAKIKCKAIKNESTNFILNEGKLEIRKKDGRLIDNFSLLLKQNLTINIQ